jgi:hypothetical protein
MLDGPSKAAKGITAYVLIVFAKACVSIPRGGPTFGRRRCLKSSLSGAAGTDAMTSSSSLLCTGRREVAWPVDDVANCAKARSVSIYDRCQAVCAVWRTPTEGMALSFATRG